MPDRRSGRPTVMLVWKDRKSRRVPERGPRSEHQRPPEDSTRATSALLYGPKILTGSDRAVTQTVVALVRGIGQFWRANGRQTRNCRAMLCYGVCGNSTGAQSRGADSSLYESARAQSGGRIPRRPNRLARAHIDLSRQTTGAAWIV